MSTLSERIRRGAQLLSRFDQDHPITKDQYRCADEADALELVIDNLHGVIDGLEALLPQQLSPKDKLMQGYEKIGMTPALIAKKRYGRRSEFPPNLGE